MSTPVVVALIAGSITAVGWLVNHWLVSRREEQRRRIEAQLKYVERQIEELYGPLALLVYEGRRTWGDLLLRRYVALSWRWRDLKKSGNSGWDGRCGAGPIRRSPSVATSPSATFFEEDHPMKCSPSPQQQRCLLPR
jgi:hypothetical protein